MNGEFDNKVVWIVGASGALGGVMATAFLDKGATVFLSGRNEAALEQHAGSRPKAHVLPVDIASQENVTKGAAAIVAQASRIDVLVNTTSVSTFADFLELDDESWRKVFEAKLFAYARTMRAALPHMLKQGSGAIVNISGSSGKHPVFPSHIPGASGNAAVNLMSKATADVYSSSNIRINCIAPGPIRSPRFNSLQSSSEPKDGNAGRLGSPEDIAEATLFLASERAGHIRGVLLTVDGGVTPTI